MITGINFPQETLSRLQAEADRTGKDFDTLVTEAVEAKIAVSQSSLQEAVRPIAEAIIASGMTPEEAEVFFDQELSALRAERRASALKQ